MDFFEFREQLDKQLDELSKSTMHSYLKKADKSHIDHMHAAQKHRYNAQKSYGSPDTLGSGHNADDERKQADRHSVKASRRRAGMKRASGKLGVHNPSYKPGKDPNMGPVKHD